MKTSQAINIFMDFQKVNSGKKTIKNYRLFLGKFQEEFGDWEIREINSEHIFSFLVQNSEGHRQTTIRFKYTLIKAFFNFICASMDESFSNPCDTPILRKTFRVATGQQWTILEGCCRRDYFQNEQYQKPVTA